MDASYAKSGSLVVHGFQTLMRRQGHLERRSDQLEMRSERLKELMIESDL